MKRVKIATLGIATIALLGMIAAPAQARTAANQSLAASSAKPVPTAVIPAKWASVMAAQERLLAVTRPIHRYEHSHRTAGYAGMRIDPYHNSLDLYWQGSVPGSIATLTTQAAHTGITVRIHNSPYSLYYLLQAQHLLIGWLGRQHIQFAQVGPNENGTGLTLALPTASAATLATQSFTEAAGVPVERRQAAQPLLNDRYEDMAPYYGGDYMQANKASGPSCSTGFAVINSTNEKALLTASHCSPSGTGTWYTGEGSGQTTIGSVTGYDAYNDAMIIGTDSSGSVWTGAALNDPAGQSAIAVNGAGDPTDGELDCSSGAWSGEDCGIQVVNTNQSITACEKPGVNCNTYYQIAVGEQQNHQSAGGNGDSGGPLFTIINGYANARGTDTAGDPTNAPATCTGEPASNGRACSWRIFFPDVIDELNDFGLSVLTNAA